MKKVQFLIGILLAIFVALVSLGYLTYNNFGKHENEQFSVENVTGDIRMISREHHSVLHPHQRERVRQYLANSLSRMGGNPEIIYYDSIKSKFSGTFDIGNVYCKFEPRGKDTSSSYLLLMAHLDSRFYENVRGREVLSYGAADDGYGLGVILELVRKATRYRSDWNQGLKILFTDAEEHNLDGIRSALEKHNSIFDNVGMVINIEARGVKGPALLFETSEGNSKLMDFYRENAKWPYTYSLTSAVYSLMPNFTDFTYTKPLFPGYNFSVIGGYECYHTDLDNFSNINTNSIGHYGVQIQPMVEEFLTGDYSDSDYFYAPSDKVVFSIPGITTFSFTQKQNYILNAVVAVFFIVTLILFGMMGRLRIGQVFKKAFLQLLTLLVVGALGTGIAWLAAKISGTTFNIVATKHVPFADIVSYVFVGVMFVFYVIYFLSKAKKSPEFVFEHIFGTLFLMLVLSAVLLFTIGENFFFMFPVACALVALFLHLFMYMNLFSLPALLLVVMTAVSFVYNILTALTIGSLGIVLVLAMLYSMVTVSLFYCYMVQKR